MSRPNTEPLEPRGQLVQSQFDALLEAAVDAIVVIAEDGRIRTFSPAAQRMFGYQPDEILGRNVSTLMPEPFRSHHDRYIQRYLESSVPKVIGAGREVEGLKMDGTVFPIDLSVGHARLDGEDTFVGIIRDLTTRKQEAAALHESQRALSTLTENFPGMVYRCANDSSWTMSFVSGGCLALTGYPPESFTDGSVAFADLIHADDLKRVRHEVNSALAARTPFDITYRIHSEVGEVRWVSERGVGVFPELGGQIRFIEGFIEDMTAQKEANHLLREKEELIRAAFDHAPIAIVTYDLEGRILGANRAASRIFGYSSKEFLEMTVGGLTGGNDPASIEDLFRQMKDGEVDSHVMDRQCIRKDGTVVNGRMHASSVRDDDGHPTMLVAQFEDRTERQQAEQEAEHLRERLAHVGRLGMIGEMATGIAHEINQPLTAISNYAQACRFMLEKGTADYQRIQEILEKISLSARRAGDVIRHLRHFVRKRESQRDLVHINDLVNDVAALMEAETRLSDLEIHVQRGESLPPVVVDKIQIQQVILNLIRNGMDATRDVEVQENVLWVRIEAPKDSVIQVTVTDRGTGIPESVGADVFHPFVTTKESGLGMGLSICRSIIDAHGGSLWFTSNSGAGTSFHFTLPTALEGEERQI